METCMGSTHCHISQNCILTHTHMPSPSLSCPHLPSHSLLPSPILPSPSPPLPSPSLLPSPLPSPIPPDGPKASTKRPPLRSCSETVPKWPPSPTPLPVGRRRTATANMSGSGSGGQLCGRGGLNPPLPGTEGGRKGQGGGADGTVAQSPYTYVLTDTRIMWITYNIN